MKYPKVIHSNKMKFNWSSHIAVVNEVFIISLTNSCSLEE